MRSVTRNGWRLTNGMLLKITREYGKVWLSAVFYAHHDRRDHNVHASGLTLRDALREMYRRIRLEMQPPHGPPYPPRSYWQAVAARNAAAQDDEDAFDPWDECPYYDGDPRADRWHAARARHWRDESLYAMYDY